MFTLSANELPSPLVEHLNAFAHQRPDWTPERLLHNALSLFLLQNGITDRNISQLYLQSLFGERFVPAADNKLPGDL